MSSKEKEFTEIYNTVGTAFDAGGITGYIARLKKRTAHVDEYIAWAARKRPSIEHPSTKPQDLLVRLKALRFSNIPTLKKFALDLHKVADRTILLAQDTARRFVVAPDVDVLHAKPRKPNTPKADSKSHPCILALDAATGSAAGTTTIPKYVFILGRLLWRDIRPIQEIPPNELLGVEIEPDKRPYEPTNYAVVLDVTSPLKGVWIVYNRHALDAIGALDEQPPGSVPVVFPEVGDKVNFESAQILASVKDWDVSKPTSPGQMERSIIKTKGTVPLSARVPALEDVAKFIV